MTRLVLPVLLSCCLLSAQDTRPSKSPEQVVEALLGQSPTVRKQALDWAKSHLDEVAPLLAGALEKPSSRPIPFDAIRSLGDLKDPRISVVLMDLAQRPEFPWKPHALDALADHAWPRAAGVFAKNIQSPVARSRAACCRGIGALGIMEMEGLVAERLGDEEAPVRLEAARALSKMGDKTGIPVVVKDLSLDRRFADADPGSVAREAAGAFLKEAGVPAELIPAGVADEKALNAILSWLKTRLEAAAHRFPETLVPHEPDVDVSFRYAIEVRSCFEGDLYARFDDEGNVVLGRDLLRRFAPGKAAVAPILETLRAIDTGGKPRKILGAINCDFERLAIRDGDGWRVLVIGPGKRDPSFDGFEAAVAGVVRQLRGDVHAERQKRRVTPFRVGAESAASGPAQSRPAGTR